MKGQSLAFHYINQKKNDMEKEFITTSQDSGKGDALVNVNVKPNPNFKSREVNLDVSNSKGIHRNVKAIQSGIPIWASIHFINNDGKILEVITSGFTMTNYPCEHVKISSDSSILYCSVALLVLKSLLDVPGNELTIDTTNGVTTYFDHKYNLGDYNLYVYGDNNHEIFIDPQDSVDVTISENSNFDPIWWEFTLNWE